MSKLLTVFGATGNQGGSLINHILHNPELSKLYRLRGITRDKSKQSAISLRDKGVEIVEADLDIPSTLVAAIDGSYIVFSVTNFWEKGLAEVEITQGKTIADVSVATGVTLLIWSSLPNITEISNGKMTGVKHFDSKATVETYIRGLPIKSVFYMAGWYMQNHIFYMPPKLKSNGEYGFTQTWSPTTKVPMIDINDTGKFLTPVLLNPAQYEGKRLTCAAAYYTPLQLVNGWAKVTGKRVVYEQTTMGDVNSNLTAEMKRELKSNAGFMDKCSYFGPTGEDDLKWTLDQMNETPTEWEAFLKANEPWFG